MSAGGTSAHGSCHCGNVEFTFESPSVPDELPVRADTCEFCRKHAARTTSDPRGRAHITVHAAEYLSRYRFGLGTADFLVCTRCGVYVAAVLAEDNCSYATVNLNTVEGPGMFTRDAVPVSYDGETEAARRARRKENWTPAVVVVEDDGAYGVG